MTWDGKGVSRNAEGRVVMIAGALPGDSVTAEIKPSGGRGPWLGKVIDIVTPSPDRIPHPCSFHQDGCLGTPLGSWRYDTALAWKTRHLSQTLKRIGGLEDPPIADPMAAPVLWGYRERLELHPLQKQGGWGLGYLSSEGFSPLSDCLLASASVREGLVNLTVVLSNISSISRGQSPWPSPARHAPRLLIRDNGHGGAVAVLMIRDTEGPVTSAFRQALRKARLAGWQIRQVPDMKARFFLSQVLEEEGDYRVFLKIGAEKEIPLDPLVFSQVNRPVAQILVHRVMEMLPPQGEVMDLYGGYGAFGLEFALTRGGKALVVEASLAAVTAGQEFADKLGLPVEYQLMDLSQHTPPVMTLKKYPAAIVDPPRSGLHPPILGALNVSGPPLLIYISCHPAALARDLRLLTSYHAETFIPIDLFPQTPDVETIAVLVRN